MYCKHGISEKVGCAKCFSLASKPIKKTFYRIVNNEGDCHQAYDNLPAAKKALKAIRIERVRMEV